MTVAQLSQSFQDCATRFKDIGKPERFQISVNCIPGLDLDQLSKRAKLPHSMLYSTSPKQIRSAGFSVAPDRDRQVTDGHSVIYVRRGAKHLPNGIEIARLVQAFEGPVANPHPTRRQKGGRP